MIPLNPLRLSIKVILGCPHIPASRESAGTVSSEEVCSDPFRGPVLTWNTHGTRLAGLRMLVKSELGMKTLALLPSCGSSSSASWALFRLLGSPVWTREGFAD